MRILRATGERARMRKRRLPLWMLVPLLLAVGLATASCGTTWPRRDPTGEPFPTVTGNSLAGEPVQLPAVGAGAPLLLLDGDGRVVFCHDRGFSVGSLQRLQQARAALPAR